MQAQVHAASFGVAGSSQLTPIVKQLRASHFQSDKSVLSRLLRRLCLWREDQEAWGLLYRQIKPFLMARNYRLLGAAGNLVEDATQEVFLRLLRYSKFRKDLTDPDAFYAYLRRMCRNVAHELSLEQWQVSLQRERTILEITVTQSNGVDLHQQAEARELLHMALKQLKESDRQMLELLIEGCALSEIASKTGVHYFTAGARLCRLRARLRKLRRMYHAPVQKKHAVVGFQVSGT